MKMILKKEKSFKILLFPFLAFFWMAFLAAGEVILLNYENRFGDLVAPLAQ